MSRALKFLKVVYLSNIINDFGFSHGGQLSNLIGRANYAF
jgi:hypothetical protein